MSQNEALNMSLDDIIKMMPKQGGEFSNRKQNSNLNVRGGVQKQFSNQQHQRRPVGQRQEAFEKDETMGEGHNSQGGRRQPMNQGVRVKSTQHLANRARNVRHGNNGNAKFNNQTQGFRSNPQDKRSFLNRYNSNTNANSDNIEKDANNANARNKNNNNSARLNQAFPYIDDNNNVVVRLKQTDIISVNPAGEVTLNTGGWFTQMTLDTMNIALNPAGVQVISMTNNPADGQWQVTHLCGTQNFRDGMKLFARGQMTVARSATVLYALGHGRLIKELEARNAMLNSANAVVVNPNAGAGLRTGGWGQGGAVARGQGGHVTASSKGNSQEALTLAARAAAASTAAMSQLQMAGMQSALRMAANLAGQMSLSANINPVALAAAAAACKGGMSAQNPNSNPNSNQQQHQGGGAMGNRGLDLTDPAVIRRLKAQGRHF